MQLGLCAHVEDIACWKGGNFFWKTLDMKDLSDSYKTSSEFLQTFPRQFLQPFPKRSGKSPLMWGSCYCHPHAAGALGEGHLESEMVSPGGRHPNKSMVFVSSFFSHEKYENKQRHCSSLRCRWAEKNSEHLQFKAPKTTPWIHLWDADPVPIGYVSIQGSHIFTVADDHLPSGKLT